MKNYLVTYYSKTGNNRFIAEKMAEALTCDIKEIKPSFNYIGLQFLLSLFKLSTRTNVLKAELISYDEIIVCGPTWGGLLISPLRKVIKKCLEISKPVHFATCCGSGDDKKYDKYGYERVLTSAQDMSPTLVRTTVAFPVAMVLSKEEAADSQLLMNTRLDERNFQGALRARWESFLESISREDIFQSGTLDSIISGPGT